MLQSSRMANVGRESEQSVTNTPSFQFLRDHLIPAHHEGKSSDFGQLLEDFNSQTEQQLTVEDVFSELGERIGHNCDPQGLNEETLAQLYMKLGKKLPKK